MKLIAHRGNIDGPNSAYENSVDYLWFALTNGFDVEVDVWHVDDQIWLGHDSPTYKLGHSAFMSLLSHRGVWWHAKDYNTLNYMLSHGRQIKVFAHEGDRYGLVNGGYIWTADTSMQLDQYNRTVWILPTLPPDFVVNECVYGLCTDDFTKILEVVTQ
jgi:hypothetical protein